MDMEELGYFIYMDSMEKASPNDSSDLFGDSSEDDEDE